MAVPVCQLMLGAQPVDPVVEPAEAGPVVQAPEPLGELLARRRRNPGDELLVGLFRVVQAHPCLLVA
jgi:hypothetical protein